MQVWCNKTGLWDRIIYRNQGGWMGLVMVIASSTHPFTQRVICVSNQRWSTNYYESWCKKTSRAHQCFSYESFSPTLLVNTSVVYVIVSFPNSTQWAICESSFHKMCPLLSVVRYVGKQDRLGPLRYRDWHFTGHVLRAFEVPANTTLHHRRLWFWRCAIHYLHKLCTCCICPFHNWAGWLPKQCQKIMD